MLAIEHIVIGSNAYPILGLCMHFNLFFRLSAGERLLWSWVLLKTTDYNAAWALSNIISVARGNHQWHN